MPLLLCPNDNGPMQTVQRSGIEFDICPTCRGVWLDRGELEKMLATAREDMAGSMPVTAQQAPPQSGFLAQPPPRPQERRDWDDRRDRDDRDDDYYRKKKRSSIFDIFD
jgi:uncharacterized protein